MEQPESSGIGISVALRDRFGNWDAQEVYFAKLGTEHDIRQASVIRSNYAKDGRVYLLNVPPGDYVAVAAFAEFWPGPYFGPGEWTTYFSKEIVEMTLVSVGKGQFAFAGSYVVDQSRGLKEADPIQLHYEEIVDQARLKAFYFQCCPGGLHYRGSLHESKRDDVTKNEFLNKAREDLAEGGWSALIK